MLKNHAGGFQRALNSLGKPDFHDTFMTELAAYEPNVDLARYCDEGFPDPDSIEFEIDSIENEDTLSTVRVSCKFSEAVQTGCADLAFGHPAVAKFEVTLNSQEHRVTFEYLTDADEDHG